MLKTQKNNGRQTLHDTKRFSQRNSKPHRIIRFLLLQTLIQRQPEFVDVIDQYCLGQDLLSQEFSSDESHPRGIRFASSISDYFVYRFLTQSRSGPIAYSIERGFYAIANRDSLNIVA